MDCFGTFFQLCDYGGTYDPFIGGTITGVPKGVEISIAELQAEMTRRAPSPQDFFSTKREEKDQIEIESGIEEGITTGEEIRFKIYNRDVQPNQALLHVLKPSHASYTYKMKYGIQDNSGIGRASARQTACRVVAGAIAKQVLKPYGIEFQSSVDERTTEKMRQLEKEGLQDDTMGAVVRGVIRNLPPGLGEPIYDKLDARLAYAMLSINGAKGFEIGEGFHAAQMLGSEYNDTQNPDFSFNSNHDGGVQAGISNGQDVYFAVAFKPIPTIQKEQKSIDFDGNIVTFSGNKRNDICVAPRVLVVVEAMAAMVVLDFLLIEQNRKR
ncbi:MAG TPA: chorismate synthase [Bacteroidales bacterium]|jgi:chorismate synthase|nr:chorismate synthase [Bacteroidales bacterium]